MKREQRIEGGAYTAGIREAEAGSGWLGREKGLGYSAQGIGIHSAAIILD